MGKNQSASGLTNIIQYNNGNITFVSGSTTLMSISSSGAITTTGVISGSNALSASYAANADTLDGLNSTAFATTGAYSDTSGSLYTVSSSAYATSGSLSTTSGSLSATSGSLSTTSGSLAAASGSFNTRVSALEVTGSALSSSILSVSSSAYATSGSLSTASGSFDSRVATIESKYATTGSNTFIGTQVISGSILQSGSFTTTGTIIAQTINVQSVTSSVVYSSGSNVFGNDIGNSQRFTGSVLITGSLTIAGASSATSYSGVTIYGSTVVCSPVGKFTSCVDAGTGTFSGALSGTTIYGSTAVCSPVGKFTSCIDAGSGNFSSTINAATGITIGTSGTNDISWNTSGGIKLGRTNIGPEYALSQAWTGVCAYIDIGSSCQWNGGVRILPNGGGNVGIGTCSPSAKLHINGSTGASTYKGFAYTYAGSETLINEVLFQAVVGGYSSNLPIFLFKDERSDQGTTQRIFEIQGGRSGVGTILTTLASGNVGIGSSTPGDLLHIEKCQAGGMGMIIRNACGATSNTSMCSLISLQLVGAGQTGQIGINLIAGKEGDYSSAGVRNAFFAIQTACGDNLYERLRITSTGNVGIGTSNPTRQLFVNSTAFFDNNGDGSTTNPSIAIGTTNVGLSYISGGQLALLTGATERMRITSGGQVYLNTTSLRGTGYQTGQAGQFGAEFTNYGGAQWFTNVTNDEGTYLVLGKSRGTSVNSNTIVQNGDSLGALIFQGTDGSSTQNAAMIRANVDGTPGAGDMPGRLAFFTTADGSASLSERMRITSGGVVQLNASDATYIVYQYLGTTKAFIGVAGASTDIVSGAAAGDLAIRAQQKMLFSTNGDTERMRITACGTVKTQTYQALGALETSGTIANNNCINLNLNSAGGNASIGFIAIGASRTDTTACQAVRMWSQYHTQNANTYSHVLGVNEGGITITNNSTGGETIYNCSGATVNYVVRYINLISINSIFERQ